MVPVSGGIRVHTRIHAGDSSNPTLLFFHGNGEVVADYDSLAPIYAQAGLNFVVAEYRGYGGSEGSPSYTAMMADAHEIKRAVLEEIDSLGWSRGRYLMGRSLGGLSALELAATDADGFGGVIMESSAANLRGWTRFAALLEPAEIEALLEAQRERLESIVLPLLTIHGEYDELIPIERALEAHEISGSASKELVVIPGAGHNDILYTGTRTYFEALGGFVARCEASTGAQL
jgi:uncharacterized protein